jgi:uncharacterized membrane protein
MNRLYILLLSIIILSSCQQVLKEDLNGIDPKIVIEGLITDSAGPYSVKITMTADYYNNQIPPPVTNAIVIISDNAGERDTLTQTLPGLYKTHTGKIIGAPTVTYTLTVQVNNQTYSSTSTMPAHIKIDSMGYTYYSEPDFIHKKGYYPIAYSKIPVTQPNYYRLKFYRNDTLMNKDRIRIGSDVNLKGGSEFARNFPNVYRQNDKAVIEYYMLTKESYDFYNGLIQQLNNDGGVFSSPPANAPGNISNGALGLFQTSALEVDSLILP